MRRVSGSVAIALNLPQYAIAEAATRQIGLFTTKKNDVRVY
jgi:hypothetical protein